MARLGFDVEARIDETILQHIPEDGIRFTQLRKNAIIQSRNGKQVSISRQTLSLRLKKLQSLGLLVHEGRTYRKSKLGTSQVKVGASGRVVVGKPLSDNVIVRKARGKRQGSLEERNEIIDVLRQQAASPESFWMPDDWIEFQFKTSMGARIISPEALSDPAILYEILSVPLTRILNACLGILESMTSAPDSETAHEIVNLLVDAEVRRYITGLARLVWECKKNISLERLDGRELKFVMRKLPWGIGLVLQPSTLSQ